MSNSVPARQALFSIHDVMPETLAQVARILAYFERHGLSPPALLVVPGKAWGDEDLAQLRRWAQAGCEFVAHGWLHHTRPRRLGHRLHAMLLSRNVAEHLDLDHDGVMALMLRSQRWFADKGLPEPETYIPPAWALGIPAALLSGLPFRCVETLSGVHLLAGDFRTFRRLPLLGFEADTAFRAAFVSRWNRLQLRSGRAGPLRVSIHPNDLDLRLAWQLQAVLSLDWHAVNYRQLQPCITAG